MTFESVSRHDCVGRLRVANVVDEVAATAAVPSKQLAVKPYPTRSMIVADVGHAPLSAVTPLTNATLPAVAAMAMGPK